MKLKFDFVSSAVLEEKPREKRINFILNKVKDGTILVTDGVMSPEEEMELIKETMRRVDDGFPGIEVASLKKPAKGLTKLAEKISESKDKIATFFASISGKKDVQTSLKTGLTLIGPAKYIKEIKKNPNSFSVLAEIKKKV
ncbi:MAG: DUF2073 domain-containing protein [Candidatus Aenigmatarchaeota archaeon]